MRLASSESINFDSERLSIASFLREGKGLFPEVSIVIPNFNGGEYVIDALRSIRSQTFSSYEIIVVDDSSTDGSFSAIQEFLGGVSGVTLIQLPGRQGASGSRNAAIRVSRGRFIAFLDADDLWAPNKLELQLAEMKRMNSALSCTAVNVIDHAGSIRGVRKVPRLISYAILLRRTPIVTSSVIIDTERVGRLEMPEIERRQDLAMWLKVIRSAGSALGIDEVLGSYRIHSNSLSRDKILSAKYTWRVIREVEKLSWWRAAYYFSFYAVSGVLSRMRGLN